MYQVIEGKAIYVVEFDTMPELPIVGLTERELTYELFMRHMGCSLTGIGTFPRKSKYALALQHALETGVISEPGKYGIHIVPGTDNYEIYKINES